MNAALRRRGLLALGAAAAGGTLAVAWQLGKPRSPVLHGPVAPPPVHLRGVDALQRVDPPAPLPAATLLDADGTPHSIQDFAGKGLVLNLWATWCVPCVAELPALDALAKRLDDSGILVLPASSDRGGAPAVREFYRQHGISSLPVWLDPKGAAMRAWGARGIPTTLIIDRQGRERARSEGAVDWASDPVVAAIRGMVA